MTTLSLDYETRSDVSLPDVGLSRYMRHPSTRVLMCAYRVDGGPVSVWDTAVSGSYPPPHLAQMLADPDVVKYAFNAAFERLATRHLLKINTPYRNWRCTMALAYTQSFVGQLGQVGEQMGLAGDAVKDKRGKALIKMFSMPQRVTKAQPLLWLDHRTNPVEWAEFVEYCRQDVVAEDAIRTRLERYPLGDREWRLYELDQRINDAGLPIDRVFVENAIKLSDQRKAELAVEMNGITGLDNSNSSAQLLPWLKARGYWFDDLQKDTVSRVLVEDKAEPRLTDDGRRVLRLRRIAARASVKKYDAIMDRLDDDDCLRHTFQFAGASRTSRWSGRGYQPQNLVRTPKMLEDEAWLTAATDAIRRGDLDALRLMFGEPMDVLAGCVRSAVRAP